MTLPVKILGLGAGGHAKLVIDAAQRAGGFDIVGLVDSNTELRGSRVLGVPVLGGDEMLASCLADGVHLCFIGVGSVADTAVRRRLCALAVEEGFGLATIVHPRSDVAGSALLGEGTVVMSGGIIGPGARLGTNVAVNAGAIVEHDCQIGDHVQVATGAKLAGNVVVEEGVHLGIGSSVKEGIRIGTDAVVAGGAMVIRDVSAGTTVGGVPASMVSTSKPAVA